MSPHQLLWNPITGSDGCRAGDASDHAAAPPRSVMNRGASFAFSVRGSHPTTSSKIRVVHHSILAHPTSGMGQTLPFGDVGSMSGLTESGPQRLVTACRISATSRLMHCNTRRAEPSRPR
jgi:hypothetical protein